MGRYRTVADRARPSRPLHYTEENRSPRDDTEEGHQTPTTLEKHTPGWTPEDEEHPDEGTSSRKSELAGKGKEKPGKKASRPKESAEEGPVMQKPIEFKVWRREPEPEDFV